MNGYADGLSIAATNDDRGRKLTETTQLGLVRSFTYDSQGRLATVSLADLDGNAATTNDIAVYRYGYDDRGNQTLLVDPLRRETRWSFDAEGRELTRTLPLGFGPDGRLTAGESFDPATAPFTERFEYDSRGRETLAVSFEGAVTRFVYDDAGGGRLVRKEYFDNLSGQDKFPDRL